MGVVTDLAEVLVPIEQLQKVVFYLLLVVHYITYCKHVKIAELACG